MPEFEYNGGRPVNVVSRPKNVILFGETGVGKSSIINLLAEREVAETSSRPEGCTLKSEEYSLTFPGPIPLSIFDTVGVPELLLGFNAFLGAVRDAHKLIQSLCNAGGVDLLVFCTCPGRISTKTLRNYRLFHDVLCEGEIPLAIVVTGLEHEPVMEKWWKNNGNSFAKYGICSVAHACITSLPADIRPYADKRAESLDVLRKMLLGILGNANFTYNQERWRWFGAVTGSLKSLATQRKSSVRSLWKGELAKNLETECMLTETEARQLADLLGRANALIKRSNAHLARGSWEAALTDANKAIELDPFSPWGYERKHAALHEGGDYKGAVDAFEQMLSKMLCSSNPTTRASHEQYIDPRQTRASISRVIQDTIQNTPQVVINTHTGRLCDKFVQAASFESHPTCEKLISSMTTHIDEDRIMQEVGHFYRYAMFSHRWEADEPLYEKVLRIVVYDLERSHHAHNKLRTFCEVAREAGMNWAWSDTCCINKADHPALQEALVSMFKWYRGSDLTIIFLCDVISSSQFSSLMGSIWNTRAWTFQDYHASKVVRFYNRDWTPYKGLSIANHKESPEIISEMERATGVEAQVLTELQPGPGSIREKLYLASKRQSTRIEDMAYSLFGIFSVSLPVVYGEGNEAVGRLLAQLLSTSGDTSILAWTGKSGPLNSCLPARITVFDQLRPPHIPISMSSSKMMTPISGLRSSSFDVPSATRLYDQLYDFPAPSFSAKRMRLPCLTFQVHPTSLTRSRPHYVLSAKADVFGGIKVTTTDDLSRTESLILVHPWVDFLLARQTVGDTSSSGGSPSVYAPPPTAASRQRPDPPSSPDKLTPALELVARLRQPFGALLLAQTRRNSVEYKRVAADCMIVVQMPEDASLNFLIDNARMLDIL